MLAAPSPREGDDVKGATRATRQKVRRRVRMRWWMGASWERVGGDEGIYNVQEFVGAKKQGRAHFFLVHREGFDATADTWEPVSELRKTHNSRVENYIADLKAAGQWPPKEYVADVWRCQLQP